MKYHKDVVNKAIKYRKEGKVYSEICSLIKTKVPKATMSFWFRGVSLSEKSKGVLDASIAKKLVEARKRSVEVRKASRVAYKGILNDKNSLMADSIHRLDTAKIALSMLCLGEASKYGSSSAFYLGNSDPRIIVLFMKLLTQCYRTDKDKFRFTIQCRADQNTDALEKYWRKIVEVKSGQFYKPRIDPRTIGKPTVDKEYMGVLRVDYLDKKVQLDLESLADMIYNKVC